MKLLIISFLLFSFSFLTANASVVIYFNSFDDKDVGFSGWQLDPSSNKWRVVSGGNTDRHDGNGRADVVGPTAGEKEAGYSTTNILSKNISTVGCANINLSFWYKIKESLEAEDHIYIEWASNGTSWQVLDDFTSLSASADWSQKYYVLPTFADNNSAFALRLRSELGSSGDAFYLDELVLSGDCPGNPNASVPEPTLDPTPVITPEPTVAITPTPIPVIQSTPTPRSTLATTPLPSVEAEAPTISPEVLALVDEKKNNAVAIKSSGIDVESDPVALFGVPDQSDNDLTEDQNNNNSLFASISSFVNSRSFWLIALMVIAIAFSFGKYKKDN